jgi:hypothetical protein
VFAPHPLLPLPEYPADGQRESQRIAFVTFEFAGEMRVSAIEPKRVSNGHPIARAEPKDLGPCATLSLAAGAVTRGAEASGAQERRDNAESLRARVALDAGGCGESSHDAAAR